MRRVPSQARRPAPHEGAGLRPLPRTRVGGRWSQMGLGGGPRPRSSCRGSRELFVQEVWALLPACPEPSLPAPHTSPLTAPLEPSQKDVFPGTC